MRACVCDSLMPPTITRQPEDATLSEGSQLHLLLSAEGSPPLAFAWSHAGQRLEDINTPELNIESVGLHQAGGYSCEVWQAHPSILRQAKAGSNSTPHSLFCLAW